MMTDKNELFSKCRMVVWVWVITPKQRGETMTKLENTTRSFILKEGKKVAAHRRFAFYRWMLKVTMLGYDPQDDLLGAHHAENV